MPIPKSIKNITSATVRPLINYDRNLPLIVIHIPKAGGQSCEKIFKAWFGDGLLRHYYNEAKGSMPNKHNLLGKHSKENPILLYGHFNRLRGFGVEDYYPEISQFITILRDPFDMMVSHYFFTRKVGDTWKDKSRIPKDGLRDYLLNQRINMLNHFPREVTMENYQEMIETKFVEIGIMEYLGESMRRIAKKLGKDYAPDALQHLNATARDEEVPFALKQEFAERHPLEFAVYDYALSKYAIRQS